MSYQDNKYAKRKISILNKRRYDKKIKSILVDVYVDDPWVLSS